jgi:hypothetical protein
VATPIAVFLAAAWLSADAPARACDTWPFGILFDPGVFEPSDQDEVPLDSMKLLTRHDRIIRLSGHTDTARSAEGNPRLARRRVGGAQALLISIGMPRADPHGKRRREPLDTALDDGVASAKRSRDDDRSGAAIRPERARSIPG